MKTVVDKLGRISAEAHLNLENRPPPSTVDNVSLAGTLIRTENHIRRRSTGDIPSSLMPNQATLNQSPSASDAKLELDLTGAQFFNLPTIIVSPVTEQKPMHIQLLQEFPQEQILESEDKPWIDHNGSEHSGSRESTT